jgi:small subunit ribosomal protein S1
MRRVRDLQPYVGKELEAKIIELDKNRNNVVLSRRAWLEQTQSEVRTTFLKELQKGQVARVSSRRSSTSARSSTWVAWTASCTSRAVLEAHRPPGSEVVEVGHEVTVEVLDVDMDRERVSLSLKATQEDPWQHFARTHAIGQVVPGKVTKLVPFGAFVRVEDGIEGLVHISELAERTWSSPSRSSRSVTRSSSRSSTSTSSVAGSRCRSSRPTRRSRCGVRPDAVRHGRRVRRAGQLQVPRGLRPGDQRVARGLREQQREKWEREYAEAHARWEAHPAAPAAASSSSSSSSSSASYSSVDTAPADDAGGTLASDEALAALREKLTGN